MAVNSNFIKAKTAKLDAGDGIGLLGKMKVLSATILQSKYFTNAMAVVVLIDAYCTCWDIDARAEGKRAGLVAQTISDVCLALYTLELAMFFLVSGWVLLKDWVVQVDIAVVVCGFVEIILSDVVDGMFESVGLLRILRIMRIIRLSRLLRKTRNLRELQKLVRMMATCLKALMWSFAIFQRIDEDGSGQVTFEELVEGARKDKEFQSRLRVMDIDEADLQQLFEMCDTTGEGSIEASQFIAPMTRWVHDSKTAARFNKYNTIRTLHAQEEFFTVTQEYLDNLSCRMDCIAQKLGLYELFWGGRIKVDPYKASEPLFTADKPLCKAESTPHDTWITGFSKSTWSE